MKLSDKWVFYSREGKHETVWAADTAGLETGTAGTPGDTYTLKELVAGDRYLAARFGAALAARVYATVVTSNSSLEDVAAQLGRDAYYKQVASDARSIADDVHDRTIEDREALIERLDEECDGAVTYTSDAKNVLQHTNNENAYTDVYGSGDPVTVEQRAYFAYRADLVEELSEGEYGVDVDADKCGRCEGCDGHGYRVWERDRTVSRCTDCDKFATNLEALMAAVKDEPDTRGEYTAEMDDA